MKIAVISDIHDHVEPSGGPEEHPGGGDVDLPGRFVLAFYCRLTGQRVCRAADLPAVWQQRWRRSTSRNAANFPDIEICAEFLEIEQDGKTGRRPLRQYCRAMSEGRYGSLLRAQSRFDIHKTGKTLMVNPGALMGWSPLNRRRTRYPGDICYPIQKPTRPPDIRFSGGSSAS